MSERKNLRDLEAGREDERDKEIKEMEDLQRSAAEFVLDQDLEDLVKMTGENRLTREERIAIELQKAEKKAEEAVTDAVHAYESVHFENRVSTMELDAFIRTTIVDRILEVAITLFMSATLYRVTTNGEIGMLSSAVQILGLLWMGGVTLYFLLGKARFAASRYMDEFKSIGITQVNRNIFEHAGKVNFFVMCALAYNFWSTLERNYELDPVIRNDTNVRWADRMITVLLLIYFVLKMAKFAIGWHNTADKDIVGGVKVKKGREQIAWEIKRNQKLFWRYSNLTYIGMFLIGAFTIMQSRMAIQRSTCDLHTTDTCLKTTDPSELNNIKGSITSKLRNYAQRCPWDFERIYGRLRETGIR